MYDSGLADALGVVVALGLADAGTAFGISGQVFHVARLVDLQAIDFLGVEVALDAPIPSAAARSAHDVFLEEGLRSVVPQEVYPDYVGTVQIDKSDILALVAVHVLVDNRAAALLVLVIAVHVCDFFLYQLLGFRNVDVGRSEQHT